MRKVKPNLRPLADRFDCFGDFDLHDSVCMKWCHVNIRCAIAKEQYDQLDIMEDFFDTVLESPRSQ